MKKLTLHLGMHRCASTTMQNLLRANRPLLAERDIGMILRADMEANSKLDMRAWHRRKAMDPRSWRAVERFAAAVEAMPFGHVIVSEENLLSTMPGVRARSFYPFAEKFLACLKPLSRRFDLRLRFVVRRQDRYVESVYAFRLARGLAENFTAFLTSFPEASFNWRKITTALDKHDLATTSRFAVMDHWQGPELNRHLAALVGINQDGLTLNGRGNPSLSVAHLSVLLALNRAGVMPNIVERKATLLPMLATMAEPNMEAVNALLSVEHRHKLKQSLEISANLGFEGTDRDDFLALYQSANKQFLEHASVNADNSVWN